MKYPLARVHPTAAGRRALLECYDSGMISSISPYVEMFERALARFLDVRNVVVCSSGTAALHLACAALDFKPGEGVLVPELTYIATANAVSYTGAEPFPIEVDPATWNIDICGWAAPLDHEHSVLEMDTSIKAVICTHLLGNPCDMDALTKFCQKRDLFLIEDACEALGGQWRERNLGTIGNVGCFSFYGNKHMTTGEGGALVTNHDAIAEVARHLRSQAGGSDYVHDRVAFNYRMTGLQAAVGLGQEFTHVERRAVLESYRAHLPKCCKMQSVPDGGYHAAWVAGVELPCLSAPVRQSLAEEEIESRPMFRPISEAPMYGGRRNAAPHPVASRLAERAIMLPCLPGMSDADVAFICDALARSVQ